MFEKCMLWRKWMENIMVGVLFLIFSEKTCQHGNALSACLHFQHHKSLVHSRLLNLNLLQFLTDSYEAFCMMLIDEFKAIWLRFSIFLSRFPHQPLNFQVNFFIVLPKSFYCLYLYFLRAIFLQQVQLLCEVYECFHASLSFWKQLLQNPHPPYVQQQSQFLSQTVAAFSQSRESLFSFSQSAYQFFLIARNLPSLCCFQFWVTKWSYLQD